MHPRRTLLVTLLGGALTLGGLTGQGVAPAFALAAPTPPPPRIAQSSGPAPAPTGDLAALLDGVPRGVQVALQVLDLETGRPLVSAQGDTPMIPASTMKLLTGAAVLAERGGAGGWWSTELTAPAGELGRAELSHLTLRGSGDPSLSARQGPNSLRALAKQAFARGVRRVGELRLDMTGLNAASFEGTVLGLPMPGIRLSDWEERPPQTVTEARERLSQTMIYELRRVGITVEADGVVLAPAYQPYVPPARQDERGRPLPPDPKIPPTRRPEQGVASVRSASPFEFLAQTLRPSDNFRAEALLASLGVGHGGTLNAALKRERELLGGLGLDTRWLDLADGSGLSRDNRLTARFLTELLYLLYTLPYPLPEASGAGPSAAPAELYNRRLNSFAEGLPQAGTGLRDAEQAERGGTMAARLSGDLDVRAKTGTLPGVSSLAGYVTARSGRVLAFAILMNGPEDSPILTLRAQQDELVRALAEAY